ncbi:MAG: hypothetical protein KDA20_01600 [Phycisphaerales bacterium]|nr:hypothetical protein [Phycisphaerales bacterium]
MSKSDRKHKVDALMEQASEALAQGKYFDAERLSVQALAAAEQAGDYERMARIVLPLQEARRQKRLAAIDTGKIIRMSEERDLENKVQSACYLIEPMLVAAHGRDLRLRTNEEQVPVLIVVREPHTQAGAWPICMIGPKTVRARIAPPPKGKDGQPHPTIEWMVAASEALGDEAIAMVDPDADVTDRVKQLHELLSTCPEHEKLHQALEEACREAARLAPATR